MLIILTYSVVLIMKTTQDNFGQMTIMTIGSLHRFTLRQGWCNLGHLYQGNAENIQR